MDENNNVSKTSLLCSICGKDFKQKAHIAVIADVTMEAAAHTKLMLWQDLVHSQVSKIMSL